MSPEEVNQTENTMIIAWENILYEMYKDNDNPK